jgi:cytochrome c553
MAKKRAYPRTDALPHAIVTVVCDGAWSAVFALVALLSLAACTGHETAGDNENVASISVCSSCHGRQGRSVSSDFPDIAGQQKDYLIAQLKALRDKTRADPHAQTYMWGMTAGLDDAMIERLAAYYSTQRPASGSTQDPTEVAAGKKIFEAGVPDKNVPPCLTCHGAKAAGAGTTPRLAGQHRASLERQLAAFAANTRANAVMHQESKDLTDRQISDVSAYLAAQ